MAATDPLGITANPYQVYERRGKVKDLAEIEAICRKLEVARLVIGLPLDAEGQVGKSAAKIKEFADEIGRHLAKQGLQIEIELWDERYSTAIAQGRLIEFDVTRARRKEVIDKMAALVILQEYMEAHEDT